MRNKKRSLGLGPKNQTSETPTTIEDAAKELAQFLYERYVRQKAAQKDNPINQNRETGFSRESKKS